MKLGKLQGAWIQSLKKNPERQMSSQLGNGAPKCYTACCLGELHIVHHKLSKKKLPFDNGALRDGKHGTILGNSWRKYALRDSSGAFKTPVMLEDKDEKCVSLANMNDRGVTWTQIAEYVENNLDNVFTESI